MSDKLEADNKSEISEFPISHGWPWRPMGPCSETSCGHPKNSTAESIEQYEAELACDNLILQLCEGASILKMDTSEYLAKLAAIFGKSDKRNKSTADNLTTDNPTADNLTADNKTADKTTADKTTADNPTADNLTADNPTADNLTADNPTADKTTTGNPTADKTTTGNLTMYKPSDELIIIATFINCQIPKHLRLTYDDKKPTDKEERENSANLDGSDKEEPAEPGESEEPAESRESEEPVESRDSEEPGESRDSEEPAEQEDSEEPETKSIKKAAKS
jgi:hypothetical protein